MIDNYLSWVKMHRKYAIAEAFRCIRLSRETDDEWINGFYRGMALVLGLECSHHRKLQKSLEAHLEYACTHSSPEVWQEFSSKLLS